MPLPKVIRMRLDDLVDTAHVESLEHLVELLSNIRGKESQHEVAVS